MPGKKLREKKRAQPSARARPAWALSFKLVWHEHPKVDGEPERRPLRYYLRRCAQIRGEELRPLVIWAAAAGRFWKQLVIGAEDRRIFISDAATQIPVRASHSPDGFEVAVRLLDDVGKPLDAKGVTLDVQGATQGAPRADGLARVLTLTPGPEKRVTVKLRQSPPKFPQDRVEITSPATCTDDLNVPSGRP